MEMQVYLTREDISYSRTTVHKYMNGLLGVKSIVRPKKPAYKHGDAHKVFLQKSAVIRTQIFSPAILAALCGIALIRSKTSVKSIDETIANKICGGAHVHNSQIDTYEQILMDLL